MPVLARLSPLLIAAGLGLGGCGGDAAVSGREAAADAPAPTPTATAPAAPAPAPAAPAATVYRWDAAAFRAPDGGPFTASQERGPDGATRVRITTRGDGWNTYIKVPVGVLSGGHDYAAALAYEVVSPPPYPGTFHMFARSAKLGMGRDAWVNWLGDPGDRGTARLPMSLPPADDWTFSVGIKGAGSIIVESLVITDGTGFIHLPPGRTAAPTATDGKDEATGCAAVSVDPPAAGSGLVIQASEFGLVADGPDGAPTPAVAAANALALHRAFRACGERSASRLVIAPGTYHLNPKDPIGLGDLHDLTIDGQGAELVFTKLMRNVAALNLTGCKRLVMRDLVIDWDWTTCPIASLAQVEAVSDDGLGCTLRFPDLDAAATARVKTAPWMSFNPVDPQTFRPLGDGQHVEPKGATSEQVADSNALQVQFKTPQPLRVGEFRLIRHLYYEMGAFKIGNCSNVLFQRVTIYSMPGMGWVGRGDLDHLVLDDCRIMRRPGTRRPMSTAADGFHILDSQGGIALTGCTISGTGDDCINIHDNCCQGVRKTGPATLVLVNNPRFRMKAAVGDRLEIFRADYAPTGWSGTATAVTFSGNDTIVEFEQPLPELVSPLSIVTNHRYETCDVRIAGCHFEFGRVLVSAKRATIEDCEFDHPFANAMQLHTEIVRDLWAEGHGAEDVVIRRNRIIAANLRGKFGGAVIYGAPVLPAGRTNHPIFRKILIADNTFIDSRGPIVSLGACADVVVRGNRIEAATPVPGANARAGCLLVECSSDIHLGGNSWIAGGGQVLTGVLYDPATTRGLDAAGNRLVEDAVR